MCMSMIYVHADGKEQGSYFCHGINDYRLTVEKEDIEDFYDNLYGAHTP